MRRLKHRTKSNALSLSRGGDAPIFCTASITAFIADQLNLKNRLQEHNAGEAAVWTKKRRLVKLVYFGAHNFLPSTRRREGQIKSCGPS
jgi:hypothetical protein